MDVADGGELFDAVRPERDDFDGAVSPDGNLSEELVGHLRRSQDAPVAHHRSHLRPIPLDSSPQIIILKIKMDWWDRERLDAS